MPWVAVGSQSSSPPLGGHRSPDPRLLAKDGRMSYTDLGKATGLSTSAVHQRVKRLEQRGLILGYGATVDHAEIGLPLTAFISIAPFDPSSPTTTPSGSAACRDRAAGRWPARSPTSSRCASHSPWRARGPAGPDPGRGERVHAHDDRALDALREPAGRGLRDAVGHPARQLGHRSRPRPQCAWSAAVRRDASATSAARSADSSRSACSAHHAWPSAGSVWIGS